MVPEPTTLGVGATAQEAAALLAESAEVRAVFVCGDDGALVGVITRKTLVREVVAAGLDPTSVRLRRRSPSRRSSRSTPALAARRGVPDRSRSDDLERVPVVEDGRLVGVLSRAVVQRRLAEDEPPERDRIRRGRSSSRCRRRAAPRPRRARAAPRRRARRRRGCRARSPRSRRARRSRAISARITAPATITGARSGSSAGTRAPLRERQRREPLELRARGRRA